jgi:glycolate oxidase FAD binding subunit
LQEKMQFPSETSTILCKIGVIPNVAAEVLHQAEIGLVHMSSGLGMLRFFSDKEQVEEKIKDLRLFCQNKSGFLTILEAPTTIKQNFDVWGYAGNSLDLMRQIKQQFDPKNILNPGRFVGGI